MGRIKELKKLGYEELEDLLCELGNEEIINEEKRKQVEFELSIRDMINHLEAKGIDMKHLL